MRQSPAHFEPLCGYAHPSELCRDVTYSGSCSVPEEDDSTVVPEAGGSPESPSNK